MPMPPGIASPDAPLESRQMTASVVSSSDARAAHTPADLAQAPHWTSRHLLARLLIADGVHCGTYKYQRACHAIHAEHIRNHGDGSRRMRGGVHGRHGRCV